MGVRKGGEGRRSYDRGWLIQSGEVRLLLQVVVQKPEASRMFRERVGGAGGDQGARGSKNVGVQSQQAGVLSGIAAEH